MKKIFYAFLLITAIASCKKDDTLRYNNVTMGNINGEEIVSDQGNTFHIAEKVFDVDLSSYESGRVMIVCDILKETAENVYDIRLTGITNVLAKAIKTMDDSTQEEDLTVNDPIVIREIWYAGGYLNMTIELAQKKDSETPHYINLVHEGTEDGTYTFSLRHNAQGERPSEEDREYSTSAGYVSFPIASLIEGDSAKIVLKWESHKFTGSHFSLMETESVTKEYNWTRSGHEHAPKAASLSSKALWSNSVPLQK